MEDTKYTGEQIVADLLTENKISFSSFAALLEKQLPGFQTIMVFLGGCAVATLDTNRTWRDHACVLRH